MFLSDPLVRLLTAPGPFWAMVLVFFIVSGAMITFNVIDVRARGMNNRPPGYLTWWMIPIFDWLGVPVFAYFLIHFAEATEGHLGIAASPIWSIFALVISLLSMTVFIKTSNGSDWTKSAGNNLQSLNWYGRYHLAIFGLVAYLSSTAGLRAIVYLFEGGRDPSILPAFSVLAGSFFISFGVLDSILITRGFPSPNGILSRLFKKPINF